MVNAILIYELYKTRMAAEDQSAMADVHKEHQLLTIHCADKPTPDVASYSQLASVYSRTST